MIIIGEKINATRPDVKAIIEHRDAAALVDLARSQARAGAAFIDVNVGIGASSQGDEIAAMDWAVRLIASEMETPLSIDSSDPEVLEAGLKANERGQSLINSAKAEQGLLEKVVALAVCFDSFLVGLAMDQGGIPPTISGRVAACERIALACQSHGLPLEKLFFDPLVLPVSTNTSHGTVTLETISQIKSRFPGARTVMGVSNISYGLPGRSRINSAFLHLSVHAGLDAAICDPLDEELMFAVRTVDLLLGRDKRCRRYVRAFRSQVKAV